MSTILNEHGYFRSHDGARLYYSVEGPKDAPPILFCYGLVCSIHQWKYQIAHFKKHYRVIYMDYRGHNQSEAPEKLGSNTIENLARDLGSLHDELKLPALPVFGHSLGVNIILDFYRLFPEKVSALALVSGTAKDPFETMFHHNFLQVVFPFVLEAHRVAPEIVEKIWEIQGKSKLNQLFITIAGFNRKYAKQKDINEYLYNASTVPLAIFLQLLTDFIKYDATHWLHEVKVPTMVIGGEKDLITPASNQRVMKKLIPGAEIHILQECSHNPQMEKIEAVNSILDRFLDRIQKPKKIVTKKSPTKKTSARSSEKSALKG